MRILRFFIVFAVAIMVSGSCQEKNEGAVYIKGLRTTFDINLEERDGIFYLPNEETPFNGIQTSYYDNGNKAATSEIIDGLPRFGTYYEYDGSIDHKAENIYHNGQLLRWLTFYPDGTPQSSYDWVEDPETGKKEIKQWYSNGQLKFEAPLKGSKYHGIMKYYDESGALLTETLYEDGKPVDG